MAVTLGQTEDLVRRSQGMINQAVDRGTSMLADRIEHYTNVAHDVADVLRDRGEPQAGDLVETLAGRTNDVARYLRNTDGAALWSDTQDFARGRTWLLAGVGFVSGLAMARAVRTATADRTYEDRTWDEEPAYREDYAQPTARYVQ